jgi:hypothetical protein
MFVGGMSKAEAATVAEGDSVHYHYGAFIVGHVAWDRGDPDAWPLLTLRDGAGRERVEPAWRVGLVRRWRDDLRRAV